MVDVVGVSHFFAQIFPGHALLFILKGHEFESGHGMAANWIVFGAEISMARMATTTSSRRRTLWRSSMGPYKMQTPTYVKLA